MNEENKNGFVPRSPWSECAGVDCACHRREYTDEEKARIRQGDAYDPEDSDVSDAIIERGKLTEG